MDHNICHPFFSVVIPVHNKRRHLRRSVESVLQQSYENFELLLIDDASTDGSQNEVHQFNDARIKIYTRSEPGAGGYAARNFGIHKASGNYIAFLDADDEWASNHLEALADLIGVFPSAGFYAMMWEDVSNENRVKCRASTKISSNLFLSVNECLKLCLNNRQPITTSSSCLQKDKIWSLEFFPDKRTNRSGDIYAWVKNCIHNSGIAVSPLVTVFKHSGTENRVSLTQAPSSRLPRDLVHESSNNLNEEDVVVLKKFANQMVFKAWVENVRVHNKKVNWFNSLDWRYSMKLFLQLTVLSMLPVSWVTSLQNKKRQFCLRGGLK